MKSFLCLVAFLVSWPLASALSAEVLVLKGGTRLDLSKPYVVRGTQAILTLKDGTIMSVAEKEIDREATAAARAAQAKKPAPSSAPAVVLPADAAKAQQAAPRAKVRLGDSDVGHEYAPSGDDGGGEAAPAAGEPRVEIANWDQTPAEGSVTIHGNIRNAGRTTADSVGLTVSVRDENGKVVGTSAASLPSSSLEPNALMPFTASVATTGNATSFRFQPSWAAPPSARAKNGATAESPSTALPASAATKPAPAREPKKSRFVPDPSFAPPAPSASNQPDPEGHVGYLPGVEIPPPPPPPR